MKIKLILTIFILSVSTLRAQTDSLILINGDVIIGELKGLNRSVAVFKTDYSDSDFKIEWEGVKEIYTQRIFKVEVGDGNNYTGTLTTISEDKVLIKGDRDNIEVDKMDILFCDNLGSKFLDNFYANIDLGLSATKANNFSQFTVGIVAGYMEEKWKLDMYFNDLRSSQDNTEDIKRTGGGLDYKYILPRNWYLSSGVDLLSNTEQALKLRTNLKLGGGNYIIRNNVLYWGIGGGASINKESFYNDTPDRTSFEGYFGTELNLFNVSDFSLITNINAFPSFTESGRWRVDYFINTKYDLPLDFYIGLNFTMNYDNRPAEVGKEVDYTTSLTFGWEW